MKSLSILALAALAAFVPGAHTSKRFRSDLNARTPDPHFDLSPALIPEIQHKVLRKFTTKEVNNYALVNHLYNKIAAEFRPTLRVKKALKLLKPFRIGIGNKKFDVIKALGMLFNASGNKQSVPLEAIIHLIGPELFKSPEMAEQLANLSLKSSSDNTKATAVTDVTVTADPHSFLQLLKAIGPEYKAVNDLFTQNAAQFINGLNIDATWDDDLLKWLKAANKGAVLLPAIQYSRNDISTIAAWVAFSHPKLQSLSAKPSLTPEDFVEIIPRIHEFMSGIQEDYRRHNTKPSLNMLLQLEVGPLEAHPKPFDITTGYEAYINLNPRPSIISLVMGLVSLVDNPQDILNRYRINLYNIVEKSLTIAGVSTEDMSWLIQEDVHNMLSASEFDSLGMAFKVMCGTSAASHNYPDCSESKYFKKAANNGVMAWSIQLSLIRELIKRRRYASVKMWLSQLLQFNLVPTHTVEKAMMVLEIIGDTEDGGEISGENHKMVSEF